MKYPELIHTESNNINIILIFINPILLIILHVNNHYILSVLLYRKDVLILIHKFSQ